MVISDRMRDVIYKAFDGESRDELIASIDALDESIFHLQDTERVVGSIILLRLKGYELDEVIKVATSDWRDLFMGAGLGSNWRIVLDEALRPYSN